jgi:hypothetical protein
MLTTQLTDVDNNSIEIGMRVEMITCKTRNDGDQGGFIVSGYKFRKHVVGGICCLWVFSDYTVGVQPRSKVTGVFPVAFIYFTSLASGG